MQKVVFVDGFYSFGIGGIIFKLFLKGNAKFLEFRYKSNGSISIIDLARQLDKFIKEIRLTKKEKIRIIGFSMGGLISSYYLKFINNKKVDKFCTLCTPFYGTSWANYFFKSRQGLIEMRPKSIFLSKLNKKRLKKVIQRDFYSQRDFVVSKNSGNSPDAFSRKIKFFSHPFVIFWPPIVKKVVKFILEE